MTWPYTFLRVLPDTDPAPTGNEITAGPGYIINSTDKADLFIIVTRTENLGDAASDVDVTFRDRAGNKVKTWSTTGASWIGKKLSVGANDVLGNMSTVGVLASVEVKVSMTAGFATVTSMYFRFDAGKIRMACPVVPGLTVGVGDCDTRNYFSSEFAKFCDVFEGSGTLCGVGTRKVR